MAARIFLGMVLGILAAFSPGWIFIGLFAAGIGLLFYRTANPLDRRFLAVLFLAGFLVRVLLSIGLDLGSWAAERERPFRKGAAQGWDLGVSDKTRAYLRMGDSDYYSARGAALAEYLRGSREPVVVFRLNQYGWNGYVDLIGFFYTVFGFSPSAVKGINCLFGAGLGPLVFFLAMEIFGRRAARWAAWGVALFPSLMVWSASNLKDIPFIFLSLLAILFFIRMSRARGIGKRALYGFWMGGALLLQSSLRDLFYLLLLGTLIAAAVLSRLKIRGRTLAIGLGLGIGSLYVRPVAAALRFVLGELFRKHIGYVTTVGGGYLLFPDSFYAQGDLWERVQSGTVDLTIGVAILKASVYFLLEPLPGRFDSLLHLPVLFQIVFWYGTLLWAGVGIVASLRRRVQGTLFLLLPLLVLSMLIALTNGNVWTLFRIRDLVTPLLLIYASVGLDRFFKPSVVQSSWLAARVSSLQAQFFASANAGMDRIREQGRRWIFGSRPSSVRDAGGILVTAVGVNSILCAFRGIGWTGWSAGFQIAVLCAGLWGLAIRSDWAQVQESSRLASLCRKLGFQAKISDTMLS